MILLQVRTWKKTSVDETHLEIDQERASELMTMWKRQREITLIQGRKSEIILIGNEQWRQFH